MSDLLSTSLVIALVVVSVVLLSFAMRPLLPPAPCPLTDAELDEETLRGPGLATQVERPSPEVPSPRPGVIPFPRGPRDFILDEDERSWTTPPIRPWRAGEHDRRRVRHTDGEPSAAGGRDGDRAGHRQEPPSMPPSDLQPVS